jgi:hypothetical protein
MPIHRGKDRSGNYFQWGNHGKKYYFNKNSDDSIIHAYNKALLQMRAIYHSGYKGT